LSIRAKTWAEHDLPGSHGGLFLTGSLTPLGSQVVGVAVVAAFAFTVSYGLFYVIAKIYGLSIPAPELVGYGPSTAGQRFGTGPMSDPEVTVNGAPAAARRMPPCSPGRSSPAWWR